MADNRFIVYDAAKNGNWSRVMALCASHAHFVSHVGPDGMTALTLALRDHCRDPEVFEVLLDASPEVLLIEDNEGMVPLHYACRFQASAEVVGLLLHLNPERGHAAVSRHDQRGRTPLYYAERFNSPPEVIDLLRTISNESSAERRASAGHASTPSSSRPPPRQNFGQRQQTSFARDFFQSSSGSAMDVLAASSGGDWSSPGNNTHQHRASDLDDFGHREILEQHRFMAELEAHRRLKQMTGFDMERHQKSEDIIGKMDEGYRRLLLTPRLPDPRRVTPMANTMPELQEPQLPTLSRNKVSREKRSQIVPDVLPGVVIGHSEEVPPDEKEVQCLGCQKMLRVSQKAMYASCQNCSAQSPAISHRVPV